MKHFLSRRALGRVVTSLLKNEIKATNVDAHSEIEGLLTMDAWPEDLRITGNRLHGLLLDSLDVLHLTAAVNEMFHLGEVGQETRLLAAGTFGDWLNSIETAWARGVARVTFMTSGSTGSPKPCTHEFSYLQSEVDYLAELFANRTRVIALTPAHHIYGFLFTAMLPDRLEKPFQTAAMEAPATSSFQRGDLVVAFPERWQWLQRTVHQWPEGVDGVVSTAPCPPDLIRGLIDQGLHSLTEVYGSSETAGLGVRRWPEARYQLMPQWKFIGNSDRDGMLLTHSSGREVYLQDHIEFFEDGTFTLAGRIDTAVQVGGINVFPARIAALVRAQPGVKDAVMRLNKPVGNGRLKAFVVPQQNADRANLRSQLKRWTEHALKPVERPVSFTFGDDLPKDQRGKNCDWSENIEDRVAVDAELTS